MKKNLSLCSVCVFSCLTFAEPVSLEHRLELLVDTLKEKRIEYRIPGMAIAIVLNDEIILEHAFGYSNVEQERAVTPDTLFSIGSVTKSFTAAAVGVLVDDEYMSWDAPITEYLPWFELPLKLGEGDGADSEILIRDLLSHQTGFTRMHLLAFNNSLSAEETLRASILAEPWKEFRSEFLYNNVQYLASGYAAGVVAGSDWNTVVEERLFAPIGMQNSYTSLLRVPKEDTVTMGYLWNDDDDTYDVYPLRTLDNLGPAGAIVSTTGDMAQWIRFQLGNGMINGKQILSKEQHKQMWTSQIEMAPGVSYGFGWMLHENDGVIEHGGNVRGGCAEVALFPEEGLGFVLLMNVSASTLQSESVALVQEAIFGEAVNNNENALDFTPYTGNYTANFGPFHDATFEVQDKNGSLAVDVPGQMLYELKSPDEDGKWFFTMTNQIAVSFDMDDAGAVNGMRMYQAGMTFELPKEGVEIAPEIPLDELQKYLGNYYNEEQDAKPAILIQNNRLSVEVPGQMVFELHPPTSDGLWVGRVTDKIQLRFTEDENGGVTGFVFVEGEDSLTFERVAAVSSKPILTAESILAPFDYPSKGKALASLGICSFAGTSNMKQSGLQGTASILVGPSQFRSEVDFGKYGWFRFWMIDGEGEMDIAFVGLEELSETEVKNLGTASPLAWSGNWPSECTSMHFLQEEEFEGKPVWTLQLEYGDDPQKTVAIDQKNGDVLVVKSQNKIPGAGSFLPYTLIYRNYKEFDGVQLPMNITEINVMTGENESVFVEVETGVQATDDDFRFEPWEQPAAWVADSSTK